MKKYTFLFFLGLVASLFTACSDDDNLTDSITPAPESENFFANGMTFASQPGVRSITFTAGRGQWNDIRLTTRSKKHHFYSRQRPME